MKNIIMVAALAVGVVGMGCSKVAALQPYNITSGAFVRLNNNCTSEKPSRLVDYRGVQLIAVGANNAQLPGFPAIKFGDRVAIRQNNKFWYVDNDGWLKKDGNSITNQAVFTVMRGLGNTFAGPIIQGNNENCCISFKTWLVESNKPNGCFISTRYNKDKVMWGDSGTNDSWESHTLWSN